MDTTCKEHTGCLADIKNLKDSDDRQWETIDAIRNRLNLVLGGVCVSCVLLVVNILIQRNGG
jgi:hypothetical protein